MEKIHRLMSDESVMERKRAEILRGRIARRD